MLLQLWVIIMQLMFNVAVQVVVLTTG